MKTKFFLFSFLFLSILSWGQTIINPGDLVVLGVNADLGGNPDEISFACFKDITTGTNIQITDLGYEYTNSGKWEDGYSETNVEGGAILTRTGGTIPAGTVITFRTAQNAPNFIVFKYPDADWSFADLGADAKASEFNISSSGDQIFFAQDGTWTKVTSATNSDIYPGPAGRMLFAFSTSGGWVPLANSHNESALYPGMDCYNMAPTSASQYNKYTGPMTPASQQNWINRINTLANWTSYTTSALYLSGLPDLHTATLPIIAGTDADWTSPGTVCESADPIDLSTKISGSGLPGGIWSGTGVTGNTFDPSGLSGTYNITYTINCPCCISQTHQITVDPQIAPAFTALGPYCVGASPDALPATSNESITGTWNPATINTESAGTTIYKFTPDAGQCASDTTMSIIVKEYVTPTFTTLGPYFTGDPSGTLPTTSINYYTGTWSPSTISTEVPGTTTYTFTPTAGQCATVTTMSVEVKASPIVIPNVFTPNGDQENDVFKITNIEFYANSQLVILNRWGKKVFESSNYHNEWDGGDIPDGTYFYILTMADGTSYNGTVTIVR